MQFVGIERLLRRVEPDHGDFPPFELLILRDKDSRQRRRNQYAASEQREPRAHRSYNNLSPAKGLNRASLLPSTTWIRLLANVYSRQILYPGIGEAGQEAILHSHAAIVGCGALGSFHAAALARAGVGYLTIIDRDYIEPSNLHRQWLFEEADAAEGLPKAVAAERRIQRINSLISVRGVVADRLLQM